METMIKLKNTDLKVSKIALGTDSYGTLVDEALSFKMMDKYVELGGNLLDTAECYANWIPGGAHASENTIGKWMKARNNRHDLVISTKGGHYPPGKRPRLGKEEILADLDGSLKRLGTDYIDIYWLHRDAPDMSVEPIMDTLAEAVKQGKVRHIGVSNWTYLRLDAANAYAEKMAYPKLVASQIQFSAATPNVEKNEPDLVLMNKNEYEYFKNSDLSVFAFAAQAKGFFSKYDAGGRKALSEKAEKRYYNEKTLYAYECVKKISREHGCSALAAALAAVLNVRDFGTVGIVGCKNIAQLEDSMSAKDIALTKDEITFIVKNLG